MAKTKNKNRVSSDKVFSKKEKTNLKKKLNPFEVHVNKEKIRILGKKQKNEKGLPGISRSKAIQKRKATLLQEYQLQNKSNKFVDKRIGEKNFNMSQEDKTMARYTAVRVRTHKKKSIFNLADDEILTHRGQTLSEIEKFDNPCSDDEDDDNLEADKGKLKSNFVEEAHFGGGMFKKTNIEGAKTHKQLIEELISESKKRKAEQQKIKEVTLELTEKLDTEWKDLLPLVNKSKKTEEIICKKSEIDGYDKVMRELRFEARGIVSDRLKTEDEIAKEEKENLEKLEKARQQRMQGFLEGDTIQPNHRSADDLEDDIIYEDDTNDMLSYNNKGESNVKVTVDIEKHNLINQEDTENESEIDELETESEDDLSDLKISDSDSEEIKTNKSESMEKKNNCYPKIDTEITENDELKADLLKRKVIMDKARAELPYTFCLPDSYENLQNMFLNHSSNYQSIIIERIIKCNHPSLAAGNKEKLGLLFAYLLQYINDSFHNHGELNSVVNNFEVFKAIVPQIYDLANLNPENTHNSMLEVIKEKQEEYRKRRNKYPGLEVLVFLKLVSILFSTCDFRHQVVTPSVIFIEQMLIKCKVQNKRDVAYGLFLVTLVTEYTAISKRYLPASINFLSGLLHMAIPKNSVKLIKTLPPFKSTSCLLVLVEKSNSKCLQALQMSCTDLLDTEVQEDFKIRVLYNTIRLLEEFYNNFKTLPSTVDIFESCLKYLQLIPLMNYPHEVKDYAVKFLELLKGATEERKLNYIVMEAKKPKALRLYEPKIIEIYDGKRRKMQSKEKAELEKLNYKVKREKKGALREIRRDNAFLGRVKIQQQIKSDKERREKVNKIYAEAATQQHELNAMDRKKKRKL